MNELKIDRTRDFGDCIGDGFKIIGKNFKALLLGFLVYIFPILVVAFMVLFYFGKPLFEDFNANLTSMPYVIISLYGGMIISYMMLSAVIYSIFIAYLENDNQPITFSEIQPYVLRCFWQIIPVYFLTLLMYSLPIVGIIGLSLLSPVYMLLIFPALLFLIYSRFPLFFSPVIRG